MRRFNLALAILLIASPLSTSFAQTKTVAERLGYPADSKLLIIHADDLAVAHSEDAASFDSGGASIGFPLLSQGERLS